MAPPTRVESTKTLEASPSIPRSGWASPTRCRRATGGASVVAATGADLTIEGLLVGEHILSDVFLESMWDSGVLRVDRFQARLWEGDVLTTESFWTPDGRTIVTESTLVDAQGQRVTVRQVGGTVGEVGMVALHTAPILSPGDYVAVELVPRQAHRGRRHDDRRLDHVG